MSARLKHSIHRRRDGTVEVTVFPHDGRYPETFNVLPQELRRFAWAILADLDPLEAAVAAHESGVDLEEACQGDVAGVRRLRAVDGGRARPGVVQSGPRPGSKKQRILQLLLEGSCSIEAIAAEVPDAARPDALLYELAESGFARRAMRGQRLWEITPAGAATQGVTLQQQAS